MTAGLQKWLYGFLILSITTVGIALILKFGYEPAPVVVMSPTEFNDPAAIGAALVRRFYSPIAQDRVAVFGVPPQPEWHREIIHGFMLAAAAEKVPFDVVIAETQMPPLSLVGLPPTEVITLPLNSPVTAELIDKVRELKAAGKRVLIYSASIFTTHILAGNVINRYEQATGEHLLAISSGPLALRSEREYLIDPPCVGSERDKDGTAVLGCAFLKAGRMTYRKRVPMEKFVGIMNSTFPNDYLLMVSEPVR
jgi:hypothetical protein